MTVSVLSTVLALVFPLLFDNGPSLLLIPQLVSRPDRLFSLSLSLVDCPCLMSLP